MKRSHLKGLRVRVVFLGSPDEVIPVVQALLDAPEIELVGVVSQPAKPVGRKQILEDPPVARFAKDHELLVMQPKSARDVEFQKQLLTLKPDVCVTAAYGQILDDAFLKIPTRATINIHPSRLPAFRGATPVPSAILAGHRETAVTILFTVRKLDAGNIILQKSFLIGESETNGDLTARLFKSSCPLLIEALQTLKKDSAFAGTPQNELEVTHCKKIAKEDGLVNWNQSAEEIFRRFRAFEPWPGSFAFFNEQRIVLSQIRLSAEQNGPKNIGEFTFDNKSKHLMVRTGEGVIGILRLKPAGSKEMDAAGFWNGIKTKSQTFTFK